jgi:hypothetical protein
MMMLMIQLLEIALGVINQRSIQIAKFRFKNSTHNINATKSANRSKMKRGVGEEATDADATAFCSTAASTRSKTLAARDNIAFAELLLLLLLQLHAAHGCNNHRIQT